MEYSNEDLMNFFKETESKILSMSEYKNFILIKTEGGEYEFFPQTQEMYLIKNGKQIKIMYPNHYIEVPLF